MTEAAIRLFSSDLDGTLLGDPAALTAFRAGWGRLEPGRRPDLCYNTGRTQEDTLRLVRDGLLPEPDYVISGVGTGIYDWRERRQLKAFADVLEEGWDWALVQQVLENLDLPLQLQPRHLQNHHKSSWYLDEATPDQIRRLETELAGAGLDVHVVYSSSRHLDILPRWANKGNALRWLLRHLGLRPEEALVAGDTGNDTAMFALPGIKGIVVGNAQPELYQVTKHQPFFHAGPDQVAAHGVLAGLRFYQVLPPTEADEAGPAGPLLASIQRSERDAPTGLTRDQLALIRLAYEQALVALKKNMTPLGYSACSLTDNESIGTDENYRSVWARDGAITLLGTIPLMDQDEAIRHCGRQTLETLLAQVSPSGQIPANVRLDDRAPEYGGVGGIAAIDSGLWVIIAFYEYVRVTGDLALLRRYAATLQQVMDWLSAHDSNNDALLEIPEAGDWTDLFGRSYNVLYDEVLWYRANVCYGRLQEFLGATDRAGDYLRWSYVIKREIQSNFWPTTQQRLYQSVSFADQQFALGDARYLIAQITPFDYSWRCDTYANVLAYLFDVIDERKAGQAFRFMWGVGVNEPYPIANLYPAVAAGDKDWRSYYTVNLLNLPLHYHNGGIWPFVGGAWVQFVHKLGLHDMARQELHRLAELNRLGVLHEWEFNEWAHGKTGRPMGKAFQAWSAAAYIRACHDLDVLA